MRYAAFGNSGRRVLYFTHGRANRCVAHAIVASFVQVQDGCVVSWVVEKKDLSISLAS